MGFLGVGRNAAVRSACRSVALTYNDPVVFAEYAIDVAPACRTQGVKTVAVSAGYRCDVPRREFYRHIEVANIDLKGFSESFYKKLCTGSLGAVLDTLAHIRHETSVGLEITTLLIPGENDSPAEIEALSSWVFEHLSPDLPLHFTAFHPDWKMLDRAPTPAATLMAAQALARRVGLRYVYVGNVHDDPGQSTYCHVCGECLICRDWYDITFWNLTTGGRCNSCGTDTLDRRGSISTAASSAGSLPLFTQA
jgi:pyruvate formate lyase activating enzyme